MPVNQGGNVACLRGFEPPTFGSGDRASPKNPDRERGYGVISRVNESEPSFHAPFILI